MRSQRRVWASIDDLSTGLRSYSFYCALIMEVFKIIVSRAQMVSWSRHQYNQQISMFYVQHCIINKIYIQLSF